MLDNQKNPDLVVRNKFFPIEGFPILPFDIPFINFRQILDMENPKAEKYVKECIKNIVENWKYDLLKIDFLYAIYFDPRYKNNTKTPDQILGNLLGWIKKEYPHVYTIGCGLPFGPAVGLVDAMRISADTFNPLLNNIWPFNSIFSHSRIKQLEINIEKRRGFEKIWNIDPDVWACGKSVGLNEKDAKNLFNIIKSTNSLFFLGNDLRKIDQKKIENIYNLI